MIRFRSTLVWAAGFVAAATCVGAEAPATPIGHAEQMQAGVKLFKDAVRGALTRHCLDCHGGKSTKADFDLSSRESLLESGMVEVGDVDSRLLALLRHDEEPHMPLKQAKLSDATIAAIERWIELGAPYDKPLVATHDQSVTSTPVATASDYWAFRPLSAAAPPRTASSWPRTAIDRFIQDRLAKSGLHANHVADRRTLIRRAYFDLLGLPPTPEEVQRFVNDPAPDAYDHLIDQLLQSDHYGERWARHWMDVARFAESCGYEQDTNRDHAYHYRDFLIHAFNEDLPFDQFAMWQIAGDELAPDNPLAQMATGFLGAGAFPTQLTEMEFESARYNELDDMVATTGTAFLAMTIGCARCHDHKFDPIATRDYYQLAAAFTTTIRSEVSLDLSTLAEHADDDEKMTTVQVNTEGRKPITHFADGRGFPHFYPETHLLLRGDVNQKQEVVEASYPAILIRNGRRADDWKLSPPPDSRSSFRRASLAKWLTDAEHGAGNLLARVMVNRFWHWHFGRGIVATPNDFGVQGAAPTHPDLLEWLAVDLVHHGWSPKHLHKQIMTSAVYMQDSTFDDSCSHVDPENLLLWRRTPRRLEAEPLRDALLSVAGLLDAAMYGPGSLDEGMNRRSVYFFIKRSALSPTMMLFDWPEHLVSIGARSPTTTAPQALLFMNSPLGRRTSERLAQRLLQEATTTPPIERLYWLALARAPDDSELGAAEQFVAAQTQRHAKCGTSDPIPAAWTDLCQAILSSSEFIYID